MEDKYDVREYQRNRVGEEINKISAALTAVHQANPRLPERHFREIFLPLFAGDKDLMYPVTMETWLATAGNPFQAVDIINPENGQVLFTVPPLMDRNAINPVNNDVMATNIASVVQTANQYAKIHPNQGIAHLNAELTKRALIMKVPNNVLENLQTWNQIFQRYGRPPIIALDMTEEQNASSADNSQQNAGTANYDLEPL